MDRPIFTVQLPKNVIVQLTGLNILSCKDIDSNNTDGNFTLFEHLIMYMSIYFYLFMYFLNPNPELTD